jgi:hypothetical protein
MNNGLKTLHREAELQRRHVRWYLALRGLTVVRMLKALGAMLNPFEYDRLKKMGVIA